jgi:hypothetical protein
MAVLLSLVAFVFVPRERLIHLGPYEISGSAPPTGPTVPNDERNPPSPTQSRHFDPHMMANVPNACHISLKRRALPGVDI